MRLFICEFRCMKLDNSMTFLSINSFHTVQRVSAMILLQVDLLRAVLHSPLLCLQYSPRLHAFSSAA